MTDVKVGQVWKDNDPRSVGYEFRVVGVDWRYATVENIAGRPNRRRILLHRMRPHRRGYALMSP